MEMTLLSALLMVLTHIMPFKGVVVNTGHGKRTLCKAKVLQKKTSYRYKIVRFFIIAIIYFYLPPMGK